MTTPFKSRTIDYKQLVKVYRNLNKGPGIWYSVMQNGKVVGHSQNIVLIDAFFQISEAGRKRVVKTKRKNVHAFVNGYIWLNEFWPLESKFVPIRYNPYTQPWFGTADKKYLAAMAVKLNSAGISVVP